MKQSSQDFEDIPDFCVLEHENLHGRPNVCKFFGIIATFTGDRPTLFIEKMIKVSLVTEMGTFV